MCGCAVREIVPRGDRESVEDGGSVDAAADDHAAAVASPDPVGADGDAVDLSLVVVREVSRQDRLIAYDVAFVPVRFGSAEPAVERDPCLEREMGGCVPRRRWAVDALRDPDFIVGRGVLDLCGELRLAACVVPVGAASVARSGLRDEAHGRRRL